MHNPIFIPLILVHPVLVCDLGLLMTLSLDVGLSILLAGISQFCLDFSPFYAESNPDADEQ